MDKKAGLLASVSFAAALTTGQVNAGKAVIAEISAEALDTITTPACDVHFKRYMAKRSYLEVRHNLHFLIGLTDDLEPDLPVYEGCPEYLQTKFDTPKDLSLKPIVEESMQLMREAADIWDAKAQRARDRINAAPEPDQ